MIDDAQPPANVLAYVLDLGNPRNTSFEILFWIIESYMADTPSREKEERRRY